MKNHLPLFFTISFIFTILLSACADDPWYYVPELKPTDEKAPIQITSTPTQLINSGEARIRYMMADMLLGAPIDYYEAYPDDVEIVEAISRLNQGYSIQNMYDFERKIVDDAGWLVVYAGADTMINGMDVILIEPPSPMDLCNPEHVQLTPEEEFNCGIHYYAQEETFEKLNMCGVNCITASKASSSQCRPDRVDIYPIGESAKWYFYFHEGYAIGSHWDSQESRIHLWFGGEEWPLMKIGENIYQSTPNELKSYAVITFTSTGFNFEKFDTSVLGWDGYCGAFTATLLTVP
jgi:hypothetical protein